MRQSSTVSAQKGDGVLEVVVEVAVEMEATVVKMKVRVAGMKATVAKMRVKVAMVKVKVKVTGGNSGEGEGGRRDGLGVATGNELG